MFAPNNIVIFLHYKAWGIKNQAGNAFLFAYIFILIIYTA